MSADGHVRAHCAQLAIDGHWRAPSLIKTQSKLIAFLILFSFYGNIFSKTKHRQFFLGRKIANRAIQKRLVGRESKEQLMRMRMNNSAKRMHFLSLRFFNSQWMLIKSLAFCLINITREKTKCSAITPQLKSNWKVLSVHHLPQLHSAWMAFFGSQLKLACSDINRLPIWGHVFSKKRICH